MKASKFTDAQWAYIIRNAFVVAFNGRLRAECLNSHWFLSLATRRKSLSIGVEKSNHRRGRVR